LCMMGGSQYNAFSLDDENRKSLREAFESVGDDEIFKSIKLIVENQSVTTNSGMTQEAVLAASVVLASHANGFAGIGFEKFLAEMIYEVSTGIKRNIFEDFLDTSLLADFKFQTPIDKIVVPFLLAPNVKLPPFLKNSGLNVEESVRTLNSEMIDFALGSRKILCGESKTDLKLTEMKDIIARIPSTVDVFLVLSKKMQFSFFNKPPKVKEDNGESLLNKKDHRKAALKKSNFEELYKGNQKALDNFYCQAVRTGDKVKLEKIKGVGVFDERKYKCLVIFVSEDNLNAL
jgi:hypothetical protein